MTPFEWLVLAFTSIALGGTAVVGGYDWLEGRWLRRPVRRVAVHVDDAGESASAGATADARAAARPVARPQRAPGGPAPMRRAPRTRRPAPATKPVVQPSLFTADATGSVTPGTGTPSRRAIATRHAGAGVPAGSTHVVARRLGTAVHGG